MNPIKRFLSVCIIFGLAAGLFLLPLKAEAVTGQQAGKVSVSSGWLNVRTSPATSASVAGKLTKGSYVTLLSRSGAWWYVEYAKGRYGYCHGDYITQISATTAAVKTNSSNLNVRSGAGTSHARVASLPKGQQVLVLSSSGGWSHILFHGGSTGYVSSRYLSVSSGYSPVSLAVPSFKQNDSRWASVKIGSYGKTMAQIGCATTAIAMMESYRTGTTVYPDAMAQKLRYTSSGDVYWPGNYTAVTNSSGYLEAIYHKLQSGRPVLFGARNSYGSQHWVVITGFTGGTLTASGFTIHDPGTSSRTTLQQFLSGHPNFYKYFYY